MHVSLKAEVHAMPALRSKGEACASETKGLRSYDHAFQGHEAWSFGVDFHISHLLPADSSRKAAHLSYNLKQRAPEHFLTKAK